MVMDKPAPAFSVVIPAYNAQQWLGATLESWVRQTVQEFEVIVVDDGSDDATVAVAQSFQNRLNLRVIQTAHWGAPAHPCNIGVSAARGELIVQCDADDLAEPDRLALTGAAWDRAGRCPCLLFADFSEIDGEGERLTQRKLSDFRALQAVARKPIGDGVALIAPEDAFDVMLAGSCIRPCSAAIPRRVIEAVGGFDDRLHNGQDYDLYVRIAREYPFVWIQHAVGRYRVTPGSISSRSAVELAPARITVLRRFLGHPLSYRQSRTVRNWIAANYEALGYEYGSRGDALRSLKAYARAFTQCPRLTQLRGVAASLVKAVLVRQQGLAR